MSDIGIDIPFPVALALMAALYWPVTLTIALVLAAIGVFVPRLWARIVCFGAAALLAVDCLLAIWLRRG